MYNIQTIVDGVATLFYIPPPPNIYSMALLTLPPVASKALTFCDALVKPISCSCCSCTWNRSSGGRVSEGGRGVEPYDPKPPAPGPPKAPNPNICCMRAGSKPNPGAGLASDEPVVVPGVALPAPALVGGRPPSKAKGFNGGVVPVVLGLLGVGPALEGKAVFVLGEPGVGNEEGLPKGIIPPPPSPASRSIFDICRTC